MNTNSFEANTTTLGFIGLGNMGSRIVRRLLAAGYKTLVYSAVPAEAQALQKEGAINCATIAELAQRSDVVLSCVTDDAAVRRVYTAPGGVLRHAKPETVVLEMSTISPETSREIARLGTEGAVHVLDVAISGSTPAAERGELILFAGGNPNVFEAAAPLFRVFAKRFFHLGPSGAGTTMKLVVNAILGVEMHAIAEAVALGETSGLNRSILLNVLSQTAVIAPAHLGKLGRAALDDYSPQFPSSWIWRVPRMRTCLPQKQPFRSTIRRFTLTAIRIFLPSCGTWKYVMKSHGLPEPFSTLRNEQKANFNGEIC
jgi:3-hydroxyisobutyrate dehydrogenase-like beta-hydroxyacid dehydrogenase